MLIVEGYLRVRSDDVARLRGPIDWQTAIVRDFHGCEHYAFGVDLPEPDLLRIAERWRTRAAQSAHLVGDHMVEFNIAMRAAKVVAASIEAFDGDSVRKLMQIPATSFRGERRAEGAVNVMGVVDLVPGELDRLRFDVGAQILAARAEDGCELYAFSRDLIDPNRVYIAERWRDAAALAAHCRAPHTVAFDATLATAKINALRVAAYDATGERILAKR